MNALKEAGKEFLRVIALAAIPVIIVSLQNGLGLKPTLLAVAIAALRSVDKWIHESELKAKGLLPF